MNIHGIRAIYIFEMRRFFKTLGQSILSPVLSTTLYFVVFGSAIGSAMVEIDGISYGAFIIPGLIMLTLLSQSISNASFGIYFPRFTGTIYEILSAPLSPIEIVTGYVGAAATKSVFIGILILVTARFFVDYSVEHPLWMFAFLVLTSVTFSPDGTILASSSGDETIKVWDWHTGECLRTLHAPGPCDGMNISGVTGITEAQRSALRVLGAVEDI